MVQELAAAGVSVGAASDNVRDWWHPYGDYDGLQTWKVRRASPIQTPSKSPRPCTTQLVVH